MDYEHKTKKSSVAKQLCCKFNRNLLPSLESTELDYFKLRFKT